MYDKSVQAVSHTDVSLLITNAAFRLNTVCIKFFFFNKLDTTSKPAAAVLRSDVTQGLSKKCYLNIIQHFIL